MGILDRFFNSGREKRYDGAISGWPVFGMGIPTQAGTSVNHGNALTLSAVYACVRVISESVASLPLQVFERSGRSKELHDGPLYDLLHARPNPEMTSFEWRETIIAHVLTYGNAYCEIEWSSNGLPLNIWPLRPDYVQVQRVNGSLVYDVNVPGSGVQRLPEWRVHHVRGLGFNGLIGYSPVRIHANTLGYSMATREYGSRYFSNGARPGVILTHPGVLSDKARANLLSSWQNAHEGLSNSHRTRLLEEGMSVEQIGYSPDEAQFLQTQKYQVQDIARIFRVPPHMIQDLDRATFSNVEQQSIDFVTHTLRPWLVRHEQALMRDLLTDEERDQILIEYNANGLLRGDIASRYQAYMTGRQGGWLSVNDIRDFENMNPIEAGDEYLIPLNVVSIDEDGEANVNTVAGPGSSPVEVEEVEEEEERSAAPAAEYRATATARQALIANMMGLYEDAARRVVRREVADLRRALDKHRRQGNMQEWTTYLIEFYATLRTAIPDIWRPALEAMARQAIHAAGQEVGRDINDDPTDFIGGYLYKYSGAYVADHDRILRRIATGADDDQDLYVQTTRTLERWEEREPIRQAEDQGNESANAFATWAYTLSGVTYLRWVTVGDNCPYCRQLNGRTVGIDGFFVQPGDALADEETGQVMTFSRRYRHPPAHKGCDCVVVAG